MKKFFVVMLVSITILLATGVTMAAGLIPATASNTASAEEFSYSRDFYDWNFPSWNYLVRATLVKFSGNTSIYYYW